MTSKHQTVGWLICIICVAVAVVYIFGMFLPALEAIRFWLVAIPVFIAFIAILGIGAWIGWTMATTSSPKPFEETQVEETTQEKVE
jgi:predicted DNA-binding transcriptional regulator